MDGTLLKGLRLLETLAHSPKPRGVSDLARELDLTRSNVHRTLQTLCAAGFVRVAEQKGNYECTFKLLELSSAIMERVDVVRCASVYMQRLSEATEETVHLAAPSGAEVVYLHKVEGPQPVRAYSSIGGRAPAQCVASGKALIAWRTERELDRDFVEPMPRYTPLTIGDRTTLAAEVARIRLDGYAVNRGEWRDSVGGVAAPVVNMFGEVQAAVGVSGPIERIQLRSTEMYHDAVREAAERISRDLGCLDYRDALTRLRVRIEADNAKDGAEGDATDDKTTAAVG